MRHLLRPQRRTGICISRRWRQLGANRSRSSTGALGGGTDAVMIRVVLPPHLRTLAHVDGEVNIEVEGPVTIRSILDALEARYPVLRGTIRDHGTLKRRAFLRFFACEQDLSHD